MIDRSRRFSTTSVDESENSGDRIKYLSEKAVLRPVSKNLDPDDWPCYVLEEATIYLADGKRIENLLHAELKGPFWVRGKLMVDGDLRNRLFSQKYNGQYIEVSNCQGFSIGSDPITLWAVGQSGWLEIRPSAKYQAMYNSMVEAIATYYIITDIYEKMKPVAKQSYKKPLSIDEILLQFAIAEGTGLVRSEAAERMKSHAEFLLSQMGKGESVVWRTTLFFKWLAAQCPDKYNQLQKDGEVVILPEPNDVNELPTSASQSKVKTKVIPPSHLSTSEIFPSTPPTISDPALILSTIVNIMQEADISGRSPRERMTLSKAGTMLYLDYSIRTAAVAQEMIRLRAKKIISSLPSKWKSTPIYTQLADIVAQPVLKSELRLEAMNVELRRRRELSRKVGGSIVVSSHRSKMSSSGKVRHARVNSSSQHTHAIKTPLSNSSQSPEPHASKSLLPPLSGRPSGKVAGLRLASSPAVRQDDVGGEGSSVSENDSSRPRKRRRPSPPDMGHDSEMADTQMENANSSDDSKDNEVSDGSEFHLQLVAEALPTMQPRGPDGMWNCERDGCVFVVREAESAQGRARIREHFNQHADTIEREMLVKQEAAGTRLPVNHLLEKLRALGEERRLAQGGPLTIAGRLVPQAIKRPMAL